MKKSLFYLLVSLSFSSVAQKYRVVTNNLPAYYQSESVYGRAAGIKAFAITFSIPGQDTMFVTYKTIRDTTEPGWETCLDASAGSIMGRKILQQAGRTVLFNFRDDSIYLLNNTNPGDSWICYSFANGGYIEAWHQQTTFVDVLGSEDSVKVFSLLRKNLDGNVVDDEINERTILLSQNYGLIQSFDYYYFPQQLIEFALVGFENPETSIQNPDAKAVFNFDIGDEFHLSSEDTYRNIEDPDSATKIVEGDIVKKIRLVSNRIDYPDSVVYQFHDCSKIIRYKNSIPDTLFVTEDVTESIIFDSIRPGLLDAYPEEKIKHPNWDTYYNIQLISASKYNNHLQKTIVDDAFSDNGSCITESIFDPCCYTETYVESCGGPYFFWYDWWGTTTSNKLEYFDKNGDEWGNRLAKDCEALFLDIADQNEQSQLVKVYPNPFIDELFISSENTGQKMIQVKLFDIKGGLIQRTTVAANYFSLQTNELPDGMFILEIQFEDGLLLRRKLIRSNQ